MNNETPEKFAWRAMNARCHNPNHQNYKNYGARGIFVCPEWRNDYQAFLNHVGKRPSARHSIERMNNHLGYEPGNVKWATRDEQMRNQRGNHRITIDGVTKLITDWAKAKGLHQTTIAHRIARGMSERDAVMAPPRESGRRTSKR